MKAQRRIAWQRYMETHDPPNEDLLNKARCCWRLGSHREALRYLFRALTGVNDDDAS